MVNSISSQVRINGSTFPVSPGVCQGSVLCPVLFMLVMDPLLIQLKSMSYVLNICGLHVGAFAHADDIRSLPANFSDCQKQISTIKSFSDSKVLILNFEKYEAVISPSLPFH